MKLFAHNKFGGYYLQGSAVVVAETIEEAAELLANKLREEYFFDHFYTGKELLEEMYEIPLELGTVNVLFDGNY